MQQGLIGAAAACVPEAAAVAAAGASSAAADVGMQLFSEEAAPIGQKPQQCSSRDLPRWPAMVSVQVAVHLAADRSAPIT